MTIAVALGRKAAKQTNKSLELYVDSATWWLLTGAYVLPLTFAPHGSFVVCEVIFMGISARVITRPLHSRL